jgi:hypothetical protein
VSGNRILSALSPLECDEREVAEVGTVGNEGFTGMAL